MIRFVNCIRKREDVTDEIFRQFWDSIEFSVLLMRVAKFSSADHFAKSLCLHVEANNRLLHDRGGNEPYDGIFELWWSTPPDILALYDSDEGQQLIHDMSHFEQQFIDYKQSSAFFTETSMDMVKDSRINKK